MPGTSSSPLTPQHVGNAASFGIESPPLLVSSYKRHRYTARSRGEGEIEVESVSSRKRCDSRSSVASSITSMNTRPQPMSNHPDHDKVKNQTSEQFSSGNHRSHLKGIPRPNIPAAYRFSTLSFASTTPSTVVQTPGIQQGPFEQQPSGLSVSVEDEEHQSEPERNDDSLHAPDKAIKSSEKYVSGGSRVAERRRLFESANNDNHHAQGQIVSATQPSAQTAMAELPIHVKAMERPTLNACAPSINNVKTDTETMTHPTSDAAKTVTPALLSRDAKHPIGLGYGNMVNQSNTGGSWKEDVEELDRRFEDLTRNLGATRTSVKPEQPKASQEIKDSAKSTITAIRESSDSIQSRRKSPIIGAVIPPRTPSRASSDKPITIASSLSRAASPFQNHAKTSISPSQSIANLNQKGLASVQRQYWEDAAGGNPPLISPLRLGRKPGSTTPTSKIPARGPSLLRNYQETGERPPSAASSPASELQKTPFLASGKSDPSNRNVSSASTVRQKGIENVSPGDRIEAPSMISSMSEIPRGTLTATKSHRKPAPPSKSSPSSRLMTSPSQPSVFQTSVTAAHAQGDFEMPQSQSSSDRFKKPSLDSSTTAPLNGLSQTQGSIKKVSRIEQESKPNACLQKDTTKPANSTFAHVRKLEHPHYSLSRHDPTTESNEVPQMPSFPGSTEGTLFVRNPDSNRDSTILQRPLEPEEKDNSYFNYATGMNIPAVSAPGDSATFPLAKTYSDWHSSSMLGPQSPVIPTSPDLSGQSQSSFADKVYSNSPLSKSPGKRFMGKMVGAAKKAVHTGIKGRSGHGGRLAHSEEPTTGMRLRPRINLDDASLISLVPTAIQLQEQQDLQHQWGKEGCLRQEINPPERPPPDDPLWSSSRERDLPPLPKENSLRRASKTGAIAYVETQEKAESQHNIDISGSEEQAFGRMDMRLEAEERSPREENALPAVLSVEEDPAEPNNDISPVDLPPADQQPETSHQPIMNERVLSIFSRHAPRHLTMPALLSTHDGADHVMPPVMPVSVPTPVSCVRPRVSLNGTAPLKITARSCQHPQPAALEDSNNIAERLNDPSPTKTERYRKVASWAKDAAVAPPPLEGPQNDARDAALRRDEDRLAVEDVLVSPPSPTPNLGLLPSVRRKMPEVPPATSIVSNRPPPSVESAEFAEVEQSMPDGPLPADTRRKSSLSDCSPAQNVVALPTPALGGESAADASARKLTFAMEGAEQVLPGLEQQQQFQAEPMHDSPSITRQDMPTDQMTKGNEDKSGILAKTNALLEMISAIQQKLEDLPSAIAKSHEQHEHNDDDKAERTAVFASSDPASHQRDTDLPSSDHQGQLDGIVVALADLQATLGGSTEGIQADHARLHDHLQELGSTTSGFQTRMQGDIQNLHMNMQNIVHATETLYSQQEGIRTSLGIEGQGAEGLPQPSLVARLDHVATMIASIQANAESQGPVAARLDHVIDVLGYIQNKPEPLPPITSQELTAIVERENTKHVDLLRSIAKDLIRDMHNERALMVQELSSATAVEVQRHVASMNAQLEEKRQELEGLESQRKDLEATISDLLRIQSRYKGPQSPSANRSVPVTATRTMPGALPVPIVMPTPQMPRPDPVPMATPPQQPLLPARAPPPAGLASERVSTRPLPTPSPRPVLH